MTDWSNEGQRTPNVPPRAIAQFLGVDANGSGPVRESAAATASNLAGQAPFVGAFADIEEAIAALQLAQSLVNGSHVGRTTLAELTADIASIPDDAIGEVLNDPIGSTTLRQRVSNVAQLTDSSAHGLVVGNKVVVRNVGGVGNYNGIQTVASVPSAAVFTYANSGANEASTAETGGTVDRNGSYLKVGGVWVLTASTGEVELAARIESLENILPKVVLERPIATEKTKVLIPELRVWNGTNYDTVPTVSGNAYDKFDYADVGASIEQPQMVFYDTVIGQVRSSLVTLFAPSNTKLPIVDSWAGILRTQHPVARNVDPALFIGQNGEGVPRVGTLGAALPTRVDIVDTTALAQGFTKAWTHSTEKVSYLGQIEQRYHRGTVFARVYVVLAAGDADNDWPVMSIGLSRWDYSATSVPLMQFEEAYSARFASFTYVGEIPGPLNSPDYPDGYPLDGFYPETDRPGPQIFGLEFGFGTNRQIYLPRRISYTTGSPLLPAIGDTLPTLLYPDGARLPVVEGETVNFYPENMHETRTFKEPLMFATENTPSGITPFTHTKAPLVLFDKHQLVVDAAKVVDGSPFRLRTRPTIYNPIEQQAVDGTISRVLLSEISGLLVKPIFIGDSLTEGYFSPRWFRRALERWGATVTPIGSISNGGMMVEARAGTGYLDLIGEDLTQVIPITRSPAITLAQYFALTNPNRLLRNPLLREATGGDTDPDVIRNGLILDFGAFFTALTTYNSSPAPNIFFINMGTNELGHFDEGDPIDSTRMEIHDAIVTLAGVVTERIRAWNATVPIIFIVHNDHYTKEPLWWKRAIGLAKGHMRYVRDRADAHCFFAPAYAHHNILDFGQEDTIETDPDSGRKKIRISDGTHSYNSAPAEWGTYLAMMAADILTT